MAATRLGGRKTALAPRRAVASRRRRSLGRWPRAGRGILDPVTPDLGPAEVAARRSSRRRRDGRRIRAPGFDRLGQPSLDLAELRPAMEGPAGFHADLHEGALREHDVAVARRVAVALAVADEHDLATRG